MQYYFQLMNNSPNLEIIVASVSYGCGNHDDIFDFLFSLLSLKYLRLGFAA